MRDARAHTATSKALGLSARNRSRVHAGEAVPAKRKVDSGIRSILDRRYRSFEEWEREELVNNLGAGLSGCRKDIQDKMIEMFAQWDPDYGKRVRESMTKHIEKMKGLPEPAPVA